MEGKMAECRELGTAMAASKTGIRRAVGGPSGRYFLFTKGNSLTV